eukprot:SAG31_NODE_26516_length_441_cov_0.599415_1_plen_93_part_10
MCYAIFTSVTASTPSVTLRTLARAIHTLSIHSAPYSKTLIAVVPIVCKYSQDISYSDFAVAVNVCSIEIVPQLQARATQWLTDTGYMQTGRLH